MPPEQDLRVQNVHPLCRPCPIPPVLLGTHQHLPLAPLVMLHDNLPLLALQAARRQPATRARQTPRRLPTKRRCGSPSAEDTPEPVRPWDRAAQAPCGPGHPHRQKVPCAPGRGDSWQKLKGDAWKHKTSLQLVTILEEFPSHDVLHPFLPFPRRGVSLLHHDAW